MATPENKTTASPWPRVFLIVSGFLVVFLIAVAVEEQRASAPLGRAWIREARSHLQGTAPGNALEPIVDAFESADWRALSRYSAELEEVVSRGWSPNSELEEFLQEHESVVPHIARASNMRRSEFPPTTDRGIDRVVPDFMQVHRFTLMLVTKARRLEWEGRSAEAVHRLQHVMDFGAHFTRPSAEASLSAHMIGMTAMDLAAGAMHSVLRDSGLEDSLLVFTEQMLFAAEQRYRPLREALLAESDVYTQAILDGSSSTERLATALQFFETELSRSEAQDRAQEMSGQLPTFEAEMRRVWAEIERQLALPPWQREMLDESWVASQTGNELVRLGLRDPAPLIARENHMLARVRLARAVCFYYLDDESGFQSVLDPFSGAPFRITGTAIYSVGPDRIDQGGTAVHRQSQGLHSEGDIVFLLPFTE